MNKSDNSFGLRRLLKIEINKYNVLSLALLGSVGHPLFWFLWTHIDPQPYESLYLRSIGTLICLVLFTLPKWNKSLTKLSYFYWIFAITYNLPFFFTVNLINNHFNSNWITCEIVTMMVVFFAIENILFSFLIILIGMDFAALFCTIFYPENFLYERIATHMIPAAIFAVTTAIIFSYSNIRGASDRRDAIHKNMVKILKSLAGSIAHELRNPLNSINLMGVQIRGLLSEVRSGDKQMTGIENNKTIEQLTKLTSQISESISGANGIIDVILSDLSDKEIDPNSFTYLRPNKILPEIIDKYGYRSELERGKVKLDASLQNTNMIFKAVPNRFTFVIYNILKNSLYYLSTYPNSLVTIGVEEKVFKGISYNSIYIYDTGPGISTDIIPKLFGDFYTSGKKEGTGLGLAFCKRNMLAFGGDIICESELGKWTKFSLLFPKVSEKEIKAANNSNSTKKKILIVDDEQINLMVEKSTLEKNLNVVCDIAHNGDEALQMIIRPNCEYALILMDVEMPVMNGFEATKEIRKIKPSLPIVIYSSAADSQDKAFESGANEYLTKPADKKILNKVISKWIGVKYDPLKKKSAEEIKLMLKNKKILLAEDDGTNRLMLSKYIEKFGATVEKVGDGQEMINKFIEESAKNNSYSLIISDINMSQLNGDEATKEIRKYEKTKALKPIPIIAFTGDSEEEKLRHFFNAGMNDYFVKGSDNDELMRILAFWSEEVLPTKKSRKKVSLG
jgi:two-component system, CAI-1 autoinducer sensor kinase/phosphatase CqsS